MLTKSITISPLKTFFPHLLLEQLFSRELSLENVNQMFILFVCSLFLFFFFFFTSEILSDPLIYLQSLKYSRNVFPGLFECLRNYISQNSIWKMMLLVSGSQLDEICPCPYPQGTSDTIWRYFWLSHWRWRGGKCSWHPAGSSQGCF